ncbi:hypothetical protein J6590_058236 [Homalodisca vitripennis]|nr:hypothetical protein J6590_058236 [Homalodisca vitripennis]
MQSQVHERETCLYSYTARREGGMDQSLLIPVDQRGKKVQVSTHMQSQVHERETCLYSYTARREGGMDQSLRE